MCNYEMVFETPFACNVEEKEQLSNLLRNIFKQDFDFDKNEFIVPWDYACFFKQTISNHFHFTRVMNYTHELQKS